MLPHTSPTLSHPLLPFAASFPTSASTAPPRPAPLPPFPFPARAMRSRSHGARTTTLPPFLDLATAGLGLATTDSDPWPPDHVRNACHRAASTWATEVEEDLLEVRCAWCGETLPISPAPTPMAAPSAARLLCESMLVVPPGRALRLPVYGAELAVSARPRCSCLPAVSLPGPGGGT
jgi:hypothetical protein